MFKSVLSVLFLYLITSVSGWADNNLSGKNITIVYADNWAPISYRSGEATLGILPAIMDDLLSDGLGMNVNHIPAPWARAQAMVEMGKADAFITTPTPERLEFAYSSKSTVFPLPFVAAVKKDSQASYLLKDPDDLSAFKDKKLCDVLGNSWATYFYKDKPIQVHIVPTIKECLHLIAAGRAEATIHSKPVLEKYVKELGLTNKIVIKSKPSKESPVFTLLLSKKSPLGQSFLTEFDHFYETQHLTN